MLPSRPARNRLPQVAHAALWLAGANTSHLEGGLGRMHIHGQWDLSQVGQVDLTGIMQHAERDAVRSFPLSNWETHCDTEGSG